MEKIKQINNLGIYKDENRYVVRTPKGMLIYKTQSKENAIDKAKGCIEYLNKQKKEDIKYRKGTKLYCIETSSVMNRIQLKCRKIKDIRKVGKYKIIVCEDDTEYQYNLMGTLIFLDLDKAMRVLEKYNT